MRKIERTCPFTGMVFTALEYDDGSMLITHPITGEQVKITRNPLTRTFAIPDELFAFIPTMTQAQAAETLDVSRQRISQIVKNDVIPHHDLNGTVVFESNDVLEYKRTRKVGAPFKSGK